LSDFETADRRNLPHSLSLRLSLGRAVEILALWEARQSPPQNAAAALRRAADALRLPEHILDHQGRSLGQVQDELDLLVRACDAFHTTEVADLTARLGNIADTLVRLADEPNVADMATLPDLEVALEALRSSLANARTEPYETQPVSKR
jgi:glutamine synthetase adenylyltransferase